MAYAIVRLYMRGGKRVLKRGLTLREAQAHCSDPETSYSTCTKPVNVARTRRSGAWFDSFTEDWRT